MSERAFAETVPGRPAGFKRRAVSVSSDALIKTRLLDPASELPLVIEPAGPSMDLSAWVAGNRDFVETALRRHGGILFSGFGLRGPAGLEEIIRALCGEALEYRERSSPRHSVAGRVYTSTDYPPAYPIFLHNENSYQKTWPLKIFFLCETPSETGGETPIADCRRVLAQIDQKIRDRFVEKGWMYVRNFGDGFGLDWQEVFQTSDRAQVEEHCRRSGIEVEWREGGRLRTRAVRPAMTRHPRTGEDVWFNHATFFHVSTLVPEVREELLREFAESDLPTNTYYGDGSPIEPEVLDHLREAYRAATVAFPWQQGDLLLLDNMLVAHARAPYTGSRKVLVGMAEPTSREQV
ncbi:MAG TPA: TauD/TfdA family dioxygenase [Thermoanaerobaculia bacterium]|nr:TauD/TfdA family dioxygenase [Thermoanaerobaculia bacterium]